ncbi:MAG: cell division protein ZapA [Pseudomonadota bacterium]|nr:cell division protein ZapA [Pseudomonadota bacterium]
MPQVLVNIDNRSYRLSCNAGEESHLAELAKFVDAKIGEMHGSFKDIGDQRIVVMASLSIADELFEARRKLEERAALAAGAAARQSEAAELLMRETAAREAAEARVALLEAAIAEAAERIEALAQGERAPAGD